MMGKNKIHKIGKHTDKRLCFISSRYYYPFFFGGAEISIHADHRELVRAGWFVDVIGGAQISRQRMILEPELRKALVGNSIRYVINSDKSVAYRIDGVYVQIFRDEDYLSVLTKTCNRWMNSNIISTQTDGAEEIISYMLRQGRKGIVYLRSLDEAWRFCKSGYARDVSALIVASKFLAEKIERWSGRHPVILNPIINLKRVLSYSTKMRKFIGMVNPIYPKGGDIFAKIATVCKKRKFLAIQGWYWDQKIMTQLRKSKNVIFWQRRWDIREFYSLVSVLLVPSRVDEAFCRVIPEALINGIPVVAVSRGAIPEITMDAAVLILEEEATQVHSWINALKKLDDPSVYSAYSKVGVKVAQKYISKCAKKHVVTLFERLIDS